MSKTKKPARRPSFAKTPNLLAILKLRDGSLYTVKQWDSPGNTGVVYGIDNHEILITADTSAEALGSIILDTVGLLRKGGGQ